MWLSTSFLHSSPLYFFHLLGVGSTEKGMGALWEEAQKLEMEAQHLEADGLEKMEVAWQVQR